MTSIFHYPMNVAALILGGTFLVFALGKSPVFRVDRAGAAIIGASLTIAFGLITFDQATQVVDYRTIVLLFCMMIVAAYLKLAGFFQMVGNFLLKHICSKKRLLLAIILASGTLSAFFINDIVCLLFTPIVIMICKNADLPPIPYLLAVATASNIGSAATLIGNPQNILIGSLSGLSFGSYAATAAPLALVGLMLNYLIIVLLYGSQLVGPIPACTPLTGIYNRHLVIKSLTVTAFILIGFVTGVDTVVAASLGAAYLLITRRLKPNKVYASIDFNLLVIFIGLFVVIGGVEYSGLMRWLMDRLAFADLSNFTVFSLITIILSNIFSNVPAVLLLKFFVPPNSPDWWSAMAIFSTFAGNLTVTGSIANLIVIEIAKSKNIHIDFKDYLRVGLPLTLITTVLGLIYLK